MNSADTNPFYEMFFTDGANGSDFTKYFSPFLVPYVRELFKSGHVVLNGTQGCGKSMLLKLFQPEIRIAYFDNREALKSRFGSEVDFPISGKDRDFIGGGINLSRSGLLDITHRLPVNPEERDYQHLTDLFCDFFNYWQLKSLLDSLKKISEREDVFGSLVNSSNFDKFVETLREQDCWFDYLKPCSTFSELQKRVDQRIINYRKWNARNVEYLDSEILSSKTVIGEPLSRAAEALKNAGVIKDRIPVFLRIDQMEELWHRQGKPAILTDRFRHAINRAMANRDQRVSFRIGTRRYAWSGNLGLPSGRPLEEDRDYLLIDLDKRLRRKESSKGWLFSGFAADVFLHRVAAEPKDLKKTVSQKNLRTFFGSSPTPYQIIEHLIVKPPGDPQRLLKLDEAWSKEWRIYIQKVYDKKIRRGKVQKVSGNYGKNPIDALLVVAWGMQTGGVRNGPPHRQSPPPKQFPPWTGWWEKERLMQAVMQLTARHQQILFWWGKDAILNLSASNITVFISICRECWDQWNRRDSTAHEKKDASTKTSGPLIEWKTQAVAIDNVSKGWHRKFSNQPGRPGGDIRMRFIDELGNWFRQRLLADNSMSYPGGNGFSLSKSSFQKNESLKILMEEAIGWGDLYEVDHTPKSSAKKYSDPRKKYYLHQVLSPHFQIPEVHTKEPLYEKVEQIIELAEKAKAIDPDLKKASPKSLLKGKLSDLPLFKSINNE